MPAGRLHCLPGRGIIGAVKKAGYRHGGKGKNMAKLYFRYGAMGSSKTANAVMVQYNYKERGCNVLMLKPRLISVMESGLCAHAAGWRRHAAMWRSLMRST